MALDTCDSGLLRMALAVGVAQVERTVTKIPSPATAQSGRFSWIAVRDNFGFIFRRVLDLHKSLWISRPPRPTYSCFLLFQFGSVELGFMLGFLGKGALRVSVTMASAVMVFV